MSEPTTRAQCLERIQMRFEHMPKRLQQCANFVLENQDEIAVLTVADVAHRVGVAPSAVMRFSQNLGFSGYSALRKVFRDELINTEQNYAQRMAALVAQGRGKSAELLAEFSEAAHFSVNGLMSTISLETLEDVVDLLARCRMIHIVGFRRSFAVASYLAYALDQLGVPTMFHGGTGDITHTNALDEDDAVLALSYSPYAVQTTALAERAHQRSIPVIAITDHQRSPIGVVARHVLLVNEPNIGKFRTLTATTTLAMAIAVSVAAQKFKEPDLGS